MENMEKELVTLDFEDQEQDARDDFEPEALYDPQYKAIKFDLDNPVQIGQSETIKSITVRRPKFGDLDELVISPGGQIPMKQIRLIAKKLTGLDDLRIGKIEDEDIKKITLSVIYFLGRAFRSRT